MWPLSSKGTCISEFSSQEYHEKVYTKLKSYNQYLPLSKLTLFVLKGQNASVHQPNLILLINTNDSSSMPSIFNEHFNCPFQYKSV